MWEALMAFFSNLVLFTAGLVVLVLWLAIIMVVMVEAYDLIVEKFFSRDEEDA